MQDNQSGMPQTQVPRIDLRSAEIEKCKSDFIIQLTEESTDFESRVSYAIGFVLGKDLNSNKIDLDTEYVAAGIENALSGNGNDILPSAEREKILIALGQELKEKEGGTYKPSSSRRTDLISFTIGYNLAYSIKKFNLNFVLPLLFTGIHESYTECEQTAMPPRDINNTMNEFSSIMNKKFSEQMEKQSQEQLASGKAFLEENAKKTGVIVLPSGLQYLKIKSGGGKSPAFTDKVTTHYKGTLIDGTEFDSSYKRGTPAAFPVNGVIAGWTEALQLMQEGDVWRLFIPANLAYGERGAGDVIPPNAALIFDIELISVN